MAYVYRRPYFRFKRPPVIHGLAGLVADVGYLIKAIKLKSNHLLVR